jgi:hypothetical protein
MPVSPAEDRHPFLISAGRVSGLLLLVIGCVEMSDEFDTRRYLGPFVNQLYIAGLCGLDERVWQEFSSARQGAQSYPGWKSRLPDRPHDAHRGSDE